jgi:hypothetical protein
MCCGNYCYEEVWGEDDTTLVCYVCKRQSELKKAEERKAKKNEQFMKCAELLQGIMRTEYDEILTDIRDYLVKRQRCLAIESRMCPKIRETALVSSMIEDLQKYAEKLVVEL